MLYKNSFMVWWFESDFETQIKNELTDGLLICTLKIKVLRNQGLFQTLEKFQVWQPWFFSGLQDLKVFIRFEIDLD